MYRTKIAILLLILLAGINTPGRAQTPIPPSELPCGENLTVRDFLTRTSQKEWAAWIERLSGEVPVMLGGQTTRITLRHSQTFTRPDSAFRYVLDQLNTWNAGSGQVSVQPFNIVSLPNDYETRNLIVDLPGRKRPNEVVILSAHLDSLSTTVKDPSPGADDNGTGLATLLEAARLFRYYRFERTIRLVFFGGEEQIEQGSQVYLTGLDPSKIFGVINVDMIGYDSDNDRCFELHVGTLPASERIGRCFIETIKANQINLTYDYLTENAAPYSDHATFWDAGVGAVLVLENYFDQYQSGGCRKVDFNPNYHTPDDRIQFLNLPYGFDIARAALATAANMAEPVGICFNGNQPKVKAGMVDGQLRLSWQAVAGAEQYRISQSSAICGIESDAQYLTPHLSWLNPANIQSKSCYQVEALAGTCVSLPSFPKKVSPFRLPLQVGWQLKPGYIPLY